METAIDLLVNGSPMAAFAIFLIYLYTTMQKRMDALVDKFQTQLDKIRTENKDDLDEIRTRYDTVIEKYNDERQALRSKLLSETGEINRKLDVLGIQQEGEGSLIQDVFSRIKDLEISSSNLIKSVETISNALTQMQQESKLRELAAKAASERRSP